MYRDAPGHRPPCDGNPLENGSNEILSYQCSMSYQETDQRHGDEYPLLSIFIPTYNDRTDLLSCLKSIREIRYPRERIEIIIWDNCSRDDTVPIVRQCFREMEPEGWLNLQLVEWKKNEGSYIPYNLSLPLLSQKSGYILGMDADIEFPPEMPARLIKTAQKTAAAVVGARSVYHDRPESTAHGAGFVNPWTGRYRVEDARQTLDCDYVIGCCWLLEKSVFEDLGCFDPDYYINHWEVDYCLRAGRAGYRVVYEPDAVVRHRISPGGTLSPDRIYYLLRNKLLLIRKNFPFPRKLFSLALHSLFFLPKSLMDSILRNRRWDPAETGIILRAVADGWLKRTGKRI